VVCLCKVAWLRAVLSRGVFFDRSPHHAAAAPSPAGAALQDRLQHAIKVERRAEDAGPRMSLVFKRRARGPVRRARERRGAGAWVGGCKRRVWVRPRLGAA
jgi:hypothetical protein